LYCNDQYVNIFLKIHEFFVTIFVIIVVKFSYGVILIVLHTKRLLYVKTSRNSEEFS